MAGEIIRQGDPTSHGGHVIEGSLVDICHGKPIAYFGHQTYCPLCKGNFPIVEGALIMTLYGQGVALSGMKTACGASLIPTQFSDIVKYGNDNNFTSSKNFSENTSSKFDGNLIRNFSETQGNIPAIATASQSLAYDIVFKAVNAHGTPVPSTKYRITLEDGSVYIGITDSNGLTQKIGSNYPQLANIEVPYYDISDDDSLQQSFACDC